MVFWVLVKTAATVAAEPKGQYGACQQPEGLLVGRSLFVCCLPGPMALAGDYWVWVGAGGCILLLLKCLKKALCSSL